jgi:hypothetical protein
MLMPLFRSLALLLALTFVSACSGGPTDDDDSAPADDDDDSATDDDDSTSDDDDSAPDDDDDSAPANDDDDSATDDDDDDDDSAEEFRETTLNALSVQFEDGNGDGGWSPGELLNITASVSNEGPFEHMSYPSFLLETTSVDIDLGPNPLFPFFGMMVGTEEFAYWQITAPANSPTPQTIEFSITGMAMNPTQPCGGGEPFEPPCITSTPLLFDVTLE